jgi:hypothetical protein
MPHVLGIDHVAFAAADLEAKKQPVPTDYAIRVY